MSQYRNTVFNWFLSKMKPTELQFRNTWVWLRWKDEKIPVKDVQGLDNLLINKVDKEIYDQEKLDNLKKVDIAKDNNYTLNFTSVGGSLIPISLKSWFNKYVKNTDLKIDVGDSDEFNFLAKKLVMTSTNSHEKRVIPLIKYSNINGDNKIDGTFVFSKKGGGIWASCYVSAQSVSNSTIATLEQNVLSNNSSSKLVTFKYNGVKWLGLHLPNYTNPFNNCWFRGFHKSIDDTNNDALKVISFRTNNSTVLNQEINDSITDFVYPKSMDKKISGNIQKLNPTTNQYEDIGEVSLYDDNGDLKHRGSSIHFGDGFSFDENGKINTQLPVNFYEEGVIDSDVKSLSSNLSNKHIGSSYVRVGNLVTHKVATRISGSIGFNNFLNFINLKFPVVKPLSGKVLKFNGSDLTREQVSNLSCYAFQGTGPVTPSVGFNYKNGDAIGSVSFNSNNGYVEVSVTYLTNVYSA